MTRFINPIPLNLAGKTRITSGYGYRVHPVSGAKQSFHNGIDIGPASVVNKQPCLVVADGTVTYSKFSSSAGHFVCVRHNNGFSSRYLHLAERAVSVGKKVKQGDVVGKMGTTGQSTGPHLHLDMWIGVWPSGKNVNPMDYISNVWNPKVLDELLKKGVKKEVPKCKVYLDGKLVGEGILHEGRSYLPVRALENKRYVVDRWDDNTKSVYLKSV